MKSYLLLLPFLIIQWPVTTLVASFMSSPAGGLKFNVFIIYVLVVLSDVITDTGAYLFGRYAKEWLVSRYPKRISLAPKRFQVMEDYFKAEGMQTMIIGKFSHALGLPVMIAAGSARMSYRSFITINVVLSIAKSAVLVAFGYYYGKHARILLYKMEGAGLYLVAILVVLIAYFVLTKKRKKRRQAR